MFEVDGEYENRVGKYAVLAIEPPIMHVRYQSGKYAQLKMSIQGRIWENILAERDSGRGRVSTAVPTTVAPGSSVRHFIKVVSVPVQDEMMFPGWHERVVMVTNPIQANRIKIGDRIVYFATETNRFFAAATVTGERFRSDPKEYFFSVEVDAVDFFPVDIDVSVLTPDLGISRASVELEEYRDLETMLKRSEALFSISEDDFESMAELLTELTEDDDDELKDDELAEDDEE